MAKQELIEEQLTGSVIGAFFEVYNHLGFGFLERLCIAALELELRDRQHRVDREVSVPVYYKGHRLGTQRIDMIVDDKLVVETKSSLVLPPIAERQLCNYLTVTHLEVGLLLHFGPQPKFYRQVARNNLPGLSVQSGSSAQSD